MTFDERKGTQFNCLPSVVIDSGMTVVVDIVIFLNSG